MIHARILLVCDDSETGQIWSYGLVQKGLEVILSHSAEEAVTRWTAEPFDLAIIDVYTLQLDGIELSRRLRPQRVNPILLLDDGRDESAAMAAYQVGVDEYITKPLSPRLFLAKVSAWLCRTWAVSATETGVLKAGALSLDLLRHQVLRTDGTIVRLSKLECRLLYLLMSHSGQVLSDKFIIHQVWGRNCDGNNGILKSLVYRLRRKIEANTHFPLYLQNVHGGGYRFKHISEAHPG